MSRTIAPAALMGLAVFAALPSPALAHVGVGAAAGAAHGFAHPFAGLDHVLAMVAVGLYAAQLGGRAIWLVPGAFVATMIAGGMLGYAGVPLPMVEQGIGLSVVAMGLAVAFGVRLPTVAACALVGLFALFHGHAHGSEGAALASFLPYAAGFVAATVLLHMAGVALGLGLNRLGGRIALRAHQAAGLAGALAGIAILAA